MRRLLVSAAAIISLTTATSCTTVGTGNEILIKAAAPAADKQSLGNTFFHLLASPSASLSARMVSLTTSDQVPSPDKYSDLLSRRYGASGFPAAELNATVRDLNAGPPFLPFDLSTLLIGKVAELALADEKDGQKATPQQRFLKAKELIKAQFLNVPAIAQTTAVHHMERGRKVFYYYPRIRVEFSSSLLSAASVDRFSFLGLAIKLRNYPDTGQCDHARELSRQPDRVRFIAFEPKAPDIAEYTRGTITQENQLEAKGSVGRTRSRGSDVTVVDGDTTTKTSQGRELKLGADLSFTRSDKYISELKDSIEARTAGLHQDGQMFLVEYRSIKNKRIGGTYTLELMLEVPSCIQPGSLGSNIYTSEPVTKNIHANVYLLGTVRHVLKRGFTGIFTKVPEPENDDVFHQVVYRSVKNVEIWEFGDFPWIGFDSVLKPKKKVFEIEVYTGRDDARFVVRNSRTGRVKGNGKGKTAKISIEPDSQNDIRAYVEFLNIVLSNDKHGAQNLSAARGRDFVIKKNTAGSYKEVGNYKAP